MMYFMSQKKTCEYLTSVVNTTERELLSGQDHVSAAENMHAKACKKFREF